ncbi:hypothetical protein [Deinococcus rubellus]|uniref:Anti-sigma factor n=1 Tax=Deinococcus rubellus TaxID=1889240 RepID=A0ABY5YEW0_9DEIO|nr:hypothetical protein [Deinococcus rubellus]UWX63629.1 hypothetical protein N0D28_12960 [Deinococcus rubellus]
MKPPSAHPETFDDADLDDLFVRVRQPTPDDLGAAERFLSRQVSMVSATPLPTLPARRLGPPLHRWPSVLTTLLAAAALCGGILVLRPAPTTPPQPLLASSAAYDAYTSALGGEW